jgi:hypothetical protein
MATSPLTAGDASASEAIERARRVEYVAFLHRVPFAVDAHRLGYATGVCEDYTLQQSQYANVDVPVSVLDNDFRNPDVERWTRVFERHEPNVGIIGDAFTEAEAREYVEVAQELRRAYPEATLVIVPKCKAAFDVIPDWILLGYPAGSHAGKADRTPEEYSELSDWRSRRLHLLGGAPQRRWQLIQELTQPTLTGLEPADIVGMDYNGFFANALRFGDVWYPEQPHWRTHDDSSLRDRVRVSLEHAKAYWKQRDVWSSHENQSAVLEPDDPVFAATGTHFDPTEAELFECKFGQNDGAEGHGVLVEYDDGTVLAYTSQMRRRFLEDRTGVRREFGHPQRVRT